jgi:hypothetical protein
MLEGINRNPIIVGAYTDHAGICPMLAAHRGGGRTSFIGFAKAWDAFAFRGSRRHSTRRATGRELLVLRTYLETSLLEDDCPDLDLAAAVKDHRAVQARGAAGGNEAPSSAEAALPAGAQPPHRRPRPGDPDRATELRQRPGWGWMRIVRSLDEYERALRALEGQRLVSEADIRPAPRTPASA